MLVFHPEGGDTLEQVAQGGCGCPIPGGIQGRAGCGPGQPGLVAGNPAHSMMIIVVLFNPGHSTILRFYDSSLTMEAVFSIYILVPVSAWPVNFSLLSHHSASNRQSHASQNSQIPEQPSLYETYVYCILKIP